MFFLLLLLWIILNGRITAEILIIGVVLVYGISNFMYKHLGYVSSEQKLVHRKIAWAFLYAVVLCVEVVKSGLAVIKFVVAKDLDIQPQIVVFRVPLKSELLRIILANSITLTPGTITINIENDIFYVHAFDYTLGEDVVNCAMLRILQKAEADIEKAENREVDYFA